MKLMVDYGKRKIHLNFTINNFISSRLKCFNALTESGKRIDRVDDRLRGINFKYIYKIFK